MNRVYVHRSYIHSYFRNPVGQTYDKVMKNLLDNVLLILDYLLINTVINSLQRLDSSNFRRIQMRLNRPILYIGLIIKYKIILILKSKNLSRGVNLL
jgi:hypothetical protein